MSKLLEHILNENYLAANDLFEERILEIQEKKLYEQKRQVAAEMNEALGMSSAEIEAKKKAGYRKATDVLGEPPSRKVKLKVRRKKTTAAPEPKATTPEPKATTPEPKAEPGVLKRNWDTLRGKEVKKGGRAGKVGNVILKGIAGALSSVEEDTKPRRKIILRKKSTSGTLRIAKDKYKTKATNVAIEE